MKIRILAVGFFSLLVLSILFYGCTGPAPAPDNSAQLEQQTRDFLAAFTAHDADKIASFYGPDAEITGPDGKVAKDTEEFKKGMENIFKGFPDLVVEVTNVFAKGDQVCVQWKATGTASGEMEGEEATAGKKIDVPAVMVLEWKDGKISKSFTYYNAAMILNQLGLLPPQAQPKQQ
jgi:steroid delta-isomerase-like uncharacterized protein